MNLKYISMEQSLRNDAEFQVGKAQAYLAINKIDRAIGCLNKAMNKINRANLLKISPLQEAIFGPMVHSLNEAIIKNLMEGK